MSRTSLPANRPPHCQRRFLGIGLLALTLAGCSSGTSDHVWKDQVETIDRAKEVEAMIQGGHDQMRKTLERAER